ncbi:MAG: hypothetical protein ACI90V_003742 [Bacillariaceae sp.]|jgi:hypothetical protein
MGAGFVILAYLFSISDLKSQIFYNVIVCMLGCTMTIRGITL